MILSCPAKTFLLGEYVALDGGPCLLVGTHPRFELKIQNGSGENPFHAGSPAGKLWTKHSSQTKNWSAQFVNPLQVGGLGASSAEFLLLHTALNVQQTLAWEAQLEPDLSEILREYAETNTDSGAQPSGADIAVQLKGGVTLFEKARGKISRKSWGFDKLSFLLFSTGVKIPTHEHLRNLSNWERAPLLLAVEKGIQAFRDQDETSFIESIQQTQKTLKNLGFEADSTSSILKNLAGNPKVKAAKGCGALGADVILVICGREDKEELRQSLAGQLRFLASESDLSEGLQLIPDRMKSDEVTL